MEDWPRSIELGSALNCTIVGFAGGAGFSAGGGGGGGGGGTFFLQPAANNAKRIPIQMTLICRFLNMNFAS
ncbi:MAG TPA: hypothetical protein VG672_28635 [Bryobacteraceae bacterium]|nr:hypothetical protein [Bryobacteraceae bacterium]